MAIRDTSDSFLYKPMKEIEVRINLMSRGITHERYHQRYHRWIDMEA